MTSLREIFFLTVFGILLLPGFSNAQTAASQKEQVAAEKQAVKKQANKTTEAILQSLAAETIKHHILPRYTVLHDHTVQLQKQMNGFCASPSPLGMKKVKQQFAKTVLAFAAIEHIHFGPIVEKYRLERLAYWPDRKSRGVRAIKRLLKANKPDSINAKRFAKKSVAVQGLTALEYVLYGAGHKALLLNNEAGQFRCQYALRIADNIEMIMADVVAGWQPDSQLVNSLTKPKPGNKHYRNRKEVLLEFYHSITVGLKTLHEARMLSLTGGVDGKKTKPKRAAFWRSGLAIGVLRANLEAIDHIVKISGFESVLSRTPVDLQFHVRKIFKTLYGIYDDWLNADMTISKVLSDPSERARFLMLGKRTSHLNVGFSRYFAIAADLPLGFNASDGD